MNQKPCCGCPKDQDICKGECMCHHSPKPESEIVTVPSLPHEPVVTTTNKTDGVGGSEPESATTEPNEASTN